MFYATLVTALAMALQAAALSETTVVLNHAGEYAPAHGHASKLPTEVNKIANPDLGNGGRLASTRLHSKRRHSRSFGDRRSASAALLQGRSRSGFPAYPESDNYVHPLDDAGQDLEKQAVALLTPSKVMHHLTELVKFPTRSFSNAQASAKVEDFLKQKFEHMGLTTCFHTFNDDDDTPGVKLTNIVAHIPGSTADSIVVGAHYDSRPFDGKAPGAEDNGSGVAVVQAIAKAFVDAKITPKTSVYFVLFAAEEPGLVGSKAFAEALANGSEGIPGECRASPSFLQTASQRKHKAIIMDEVGWASPALSTPTVNLESFDWTKEVMDHLRMSSKTHNGDAIAVVHNAHPFGSDHMSFLDNKMQAVLTINGDDEAYPHYHQSSDTIENVSPKLCGMIGKMNLGALIRMAGIA